MVFCAAASGAVSAQTDSSESNADLAQRASSRVIRTAAVRPSDQIAQALSLGSEQRVAYVAQLQFTGEDVPYAYHERWTRNLNDELVERETEKKEPNSLTAKNEMQVGRVQQRLLAAAATKRVARYLQLRPGDPVLTLIRQSYRANGQALEWHECHCHPGKFEFTTNLSDESAFGESLHIRGRMIGV